MRRLSRASALTSLLPRPADCSASALTSLLPRPADRSASGHQASQSVLVDQNHGPHFRTLPSSRNLLPSTPRNLFQKSSAFPVTKQSYTMQSTTSPATAPMRSMTSAYLIRTLTNSAVAPAQSVQRHMLPRLLHLTETHECP